MQTRRKFIQNSGLLTAGLMMHRGDFFSAKRKKIGLQMYTLRHVVNRDNIDSILNKVAGIGYKELEVFGYSGTDKFWGLDPASFKKLLKSTGLKAPSAHIAFENFLTGKDEDELRLISDAAATIGNKYLVVAWLDEKYRRTEDDYKLIAEKLNRSGRIARQYGLQLAYHNHDFEFAQLGNNATGYDIILKDTDKELLKLELDLYWAVKAGKDPIQLFNENTGRFPLWHVKDLDTTTHTFTEVGAGSLDFKKIFEQSKLAGLQHFFIEQDEVTKDVFQSISESYEYVKGKLV